MKSPSLALALAFVALALAGCVDPEESTDGASDPAERKTAGFALATGELSRVRIEVVANGSMGTRLVVELEREDGSNVAERTLEPSGSPMNVTLEAEVGTATTYWFLARLPAGNAASLRVTAVGIAPDGTETLLRQETYVLPIRETTA